jgi:hypothetical protein
MLPLCATTAQIDQAFVAVELAIADIVRD